MSTTVLTPQVQTASHNAVPYVLGFFFAARTCVTVVAFQSNPSAGTAFISALGLLLVFAAWMAKERNAAATVPHRLLRWLIAYLAFMGLSLFWTVATSTAVAFVYWASVAADCVAVYMVIRSGAAVQACYAAMHGFVLGAVVVDIVAWSLPTMWDLRIGDEDFLHPNAIGYVSALAVLFALQLHRRSPMLMAPGIFCGVTLLRSLSKTSIAAFAAAGMFYVLRGAHLRREVKIAIGAVTAATVALSWSLLEAYFFVYSSTYDLDTLTGRTYLWSVAWEESMKHLWIGHGLYSLRAVIPMIGNFQPWQAHNELLQQLFCYGIVGLLIYVALHVSLLRTIRRYASSPLATLAGAILIMALVRGLVDTENISVNFPLWLLVLLAFALPETEADLA